MRVVVLAFLGLVALGPNVGPGCSDRRPGQADHGRTWGRTVNRDGPPRLRLGLASRRMARPLGLLALGTLLP
jgi:hypothetical protein